MESLKLRALFDSPLYPTSPIQRFSSTFYPHKNTNFVHALPQTSSPARIIHQFRRIQTTCCLDRPFRSPSPSPNSKDESDSRSDRNISIPSDNRFVASAARVGVATLTSKILGLLREVIMAAFFGVGPVATAFKYASVLPGFTASLIGGVNGPIHITMATTLRFCFVLVSKVFDFLALSRERRRKLFQRTNAVMFLVGGILAALVFVSAEFIIHFYAPGLWILAEGRVTRDVAITQLKIMIPCIVLAGPVGLGFGYMSAEGNNVIPSFSPALSSMLVIAFCVMHAFSGSSTAFQSGDELSGGIFVACGASLGAFLQWVVQVIVLRRRQYDTVPVSWINVFKDKDVNEFFSLLFPAIISSGLAQVASFTDLCLASLVPGAAAGLSYAYLLAMAPVGLLSSIIILPLLPTFSNLTKTASWPILVENLKRVILLCMVCIFYLSEQFVWAHTMSGVVRLDGLGNSLFVVLLPIISVMCVLTEPIIRVLFERYVFDPAATALVSSLFLFYSLGSPFYIVRELLVVVFYSLGDSQQPFLVSVGAIALNAILDWLSVSRYYLGAQGLALSTSFTTALSVIVLFHLLRKKLEGVVDYAALIYPCLFLSFCCIICGFASSITYKIMRSRFSSVFTIRIQELICISLASTIGIIGFFFPVMLVHFSGFEVVEDLSRILTNR